MKRPLPPPNCKISIKHPPLYFPAVPDEHAIKLFGKLYHAFVIPNENAKAYFQREYDSILKGKRVLGILSRGTDYRALHPKGHPVVPDLKDLIAMADEKFKLLHCDAIYLATEEESVQRQFEEAFPGKILINQRQYLDAYSKIHDELGDKAIVTAVIRNESADKRFAKSLEYLSSIMLLSKCCGLVAATCGGSRAAAYLNGCKYEECYLFNLGVY